MVNVAILGFGTVGSGVAEVPSAAMAASPEMREKAAKVKNETISMVASPVKTRFNK